MEKGFHPTFHWLLILPIFILLSPALLGASETDLEKTLQAYLEESRTVAGRSREKAGPSFSAEIEKLKALAEEIRPLHLLLSERFRLREENLGSGKVQQHHQAMSKGYRRALDEYLALIEGLSPSGDGSESTLHQIQALLDKILYRKRLPLLGSLPYRNLRYPLKDPTADPPITPAYLGGSTSVVPDDLKGASSNVIAALAQSLNWNPVSIYEWVKNNVETEWYFGCMKGAEETLAQKSGNDCDQASLLVALLRASGFPSRYIRGVVEFFPDIARAKNLTGIEDEEALASFFQKSGIPFRPIVTGGKISNFQIERIWVESQIPYANYRGAVIDAQGKTWIALDTSMKVVGYDSNVPLALPLEPFFSHARDQYLAAPQTQTPLEWIRTKVDQALSESQPGTHYPDLLRRRTLLPEILNILPANLQFQPIRITHEYAEVPEALTHRVRMVASRCGLGVAGCGVDRELFNITLAASELSNRKAVLAYEPETVEDHQTLDTYGGLDNTPAYLVRLRPALKVNEARVVVARDGLPMGESYTFTVEMISPNGVETFTTQPIAGNLSLLGIVSQKGVSPAAVPDTEKDAEALLYEEAIRYIDRWRQAEDELASLMRLALVRPVPTLVMVGGVIDVTYLLDAPHGFEWKGVSIDAAVRGIETVVCCGLRVGEIGSERVKTFMQLSGLQGSILENRIFEEDFQAESISTAKLFTLLNAQPETGNSLLTLTRSNAPTLLPALPFAEEIKEDILNAVNQDWTVKIPSSEISYKDWTGIGWLKEDPESGEAGWMLSGRIAGGMTAVRKEEWKGADLIDQLSRPNTPKINQDPEAVVRIARFKFADYQSKTVGTSLNNPFEVIALDSQNRPVKGVPITFQVLAGGGLVQGENKIGALIGAPGTQTTVATGPDGKARARLTLGQKTSDSPIYLSGTPNSIQAGQNLVTLFAATQSGNLYADKPFEAYGRPGDTAKVVQLYPSPAQTEKIYGQVNLFSGTIRVSVTDQYENPISNKTVAFSALPPIFHGTAPASGAVNAKLYEKVADCPGVGAQNCGKAFETLQPITDSGGASVLVILGNTDDTEYRIQATAKKELDGQETNQDTLPVIVRHRCKTRRHHGSPHARYGFPLPGR